MAKEEVSLTEEAKDNAPKVQPVVNKRMVLAIAKALSMQLAGTLYKNGWFYVPERNSAYEKGKLTYMLATEPCVTASEVLSTWRQPFDWLLQQVKKDNSAKSQFLETYGRLYKERQPGKCVWTLQFPDKCMTTLETPVSIPEGVEIMDENNEAAQDSGDGSIC